MSLSDKIIPTPPGMTCACGTCNLDRLRVPDVKEFIKQIKNDLVNDDDEITNTIHEAIDKRAGDKLL